jgi:prepilin-type N-terminal cleavage/methylation domain-containing protein
MTLSTRNRRPLYRYSSRPPTCRIPAGRRLAYAPCRSGLTLIEMILVLAVLVAAAAIALPALHGPMSDQRLRKAGDLVLAQWARARLTAMKTGQMQVFRYEIGTDLYQVQPRLDESFFLEGSADASQLMAPNMLLQNPNRDGRDSLLGVAGQRLPSGVTFFTGRTEMDSRVGQLQNEDPSIAMAGSMVQPIIFYPDGTTTQARIVLTNERFFVELKLRGLTGISRSSGLLTIEEIAP